MEPVSVSAAQEETGSGTPVHGLQSLTAKTGCALAGGSGRMRVIQEGAPAPSAMSHEAKGSDQHAKGGPGTDELLHMVEGDLGL